MCGILGYFGPNGLNFRDLIDLEKLAHRGPDFSSYFSSDKFYLGHTRLSILDLSEYGNQPMFSLDNNFVIIFNGEIYNHLELREKYLLDIKFNSTGDTETLLYGLIKYGEEFIHNLNGIFSFAFCNLITGDFLIARDYFGVKPLYYYSDENGICFSSEIKAIINYLPNKTICKEGLKNYLNFLWSPGELTPIDEVKKLIPGSLIFGNFLKTNTVNVKFFYKLKFNDKLIPYKKEIEWINLLENKLVAAVRRQVLSDVPFGFFLSGGLDSSIIVAIARKLFPDRKLTCYTIRCDDFYDEGFSNDFIYAEKVAKFLNLDLRVVNADTDILIEFDKMVYFLDEPQADPAALNVFNICKVAREDGIKVLLGGTAGDDIFSGYRRHKALKMEFLIDNIPVFIREKIKSVISLINIKGGLVRRLKKLTANFEKSKSERMLGYFDWIDSVTLDGLFKDKINFDPHTFFKELEKELPIGTNDLNKMLYWELKTFLIDHNLNYTDKLSMASGVEVRVPFLDKELVEFSTIIPCDLKMKGTETKYILKKVAERYLPKEVIYRSKTGFGAPVRKWIINDMDSIINNYLSKSTIESRGIFNYDKVKQLLERNKLGKIDASYTIWALLAIESWMRNYYDN